MKISNCQNSAQNLWDALLVACPINPAPVSGNTRSAQSINNKPIDMLQSL